MEHFSQVLLEYILEIIPALILGFLASGLIFELIPEKTVLRHLGGGGFKPILYATIIGALLPVCCWGSLPIAVSFSKKGARLGPVLAFLVATPATSVSALAVSFGILGLRFTIYIFFAVILMGVGAGLLGDRLRIPLKEEKPGDVACRSGCRGEEDNPIRKSLSGRAKSILRYAFVVLPKDIGLEIALGILLAAAVAVFLPVQNLIRNYLSGGWGYVFSVVFGTLTYLCSTASVPLVDSLIKQGLSSGAGMTLLLIGPVTSYGTLLVLKKEFGAKVLCVFLAFLIFSSVLLGLGY